MSKSKVSSSRTYLDIKIYNVSCFKTELLKYIKDFPYFCYFNSNENASEFDLISAIGSECHHSGGLDILASIGNNNDFKFGYIKYDLKDQIEKLNNVNRNEPLIEFFEPELVFQLKGESLKVGYYNENIDELTVKELIVKLCNSSTEIIESIENRVCISPRISKERYRSNVEMLLKHIHLGDIYEVNFCQEFFSENSIVDPLRVFQNLNRISEAPFSAFCRFNDDYIISSSPERFLKKKGNKLVSQPIKGTRKRGISAENDNALKEELKNDLKERSENIMIVDLVRNDLSRVAKKGSVNVNELCAIYSFKQVHQMISTVGCELRKDVGFEEIIKATFPMGSMTGAPKVRAMELIDEYENYKRGFYSGCVGYITPENDFDFNVIIRSILYNSTTGYLSFSVGSAITAKAEAEKEYAECLVKAKAMFEALGSLDQWEKLNKS